MTKKNLTPEQREMIVLKGRAKFLGVKLEEIAELTGLSPSQVSRILNGKSVRNRRFQAVKDAINSLIAKRLKISS
ncbi:MAG: helix-turn-helix domain-containing protein [Candidatus Anstonellaceae archaeon]